MLDQGILRVIDANFNRAKEGLRVVEDIFRFALVNNGLRRKVRRLRHSLDYLSRKKIIKNAILSRCSPDDPGRHTDCLELKRSDTKNILYINFQRIKESLRVLEEFLKLIAPAGVGRIKRARYEVYTLEKEALQLWPPLCNSRPKKRQCRR